MNEVKIERSDSGVLRSVAMETGVRRRSPLIVGVVLGFLLRSLAFIVLFDHDGRWRSSAICWESSQSVLSGKKSGALLFDLNYEGKLEISDLLRGHAL